MVVAGVLRYDSHIAAVAPHEHWFIAFSMGDDLTINDELQAYVEGDDSNVMIVSLKDPTQKRIARLASDGADGYYRVLKDKFTPPSSAD